jgi:hypothetical protein
MAFKFNTDFINLGPLTSTNFGIEPIDVSNVGPVAPLSNADLSASASRAASSPIYSAPSQNVINTAYLKTLGRPADPDGLAFYSSQLEDGRSVGDILADLNYVAANQATTAASDAPITPEFNPADCGPLLINRFSDNNDPVTSQHDHANAKNRATGLHTRSVE